MASNTASECASKKTHRLKQYKMTQKEKSFTKRAAAAQKTNMKKTRSYLPSDLGAKEATSIKAVSVKEEPMVMTHDPKDTFDVVAHRKALELALYEEMETPLQMLVRCKYRISIDAEYHTKEDECADAAPRAACVDDNGVETISRTSSSSSFEELNAGETQPPPQENSIIDKIVSCLSRASEAHRRGLTCFDRLFRDAAVMEKPVPVSPRKTVEFSTGIKSGERFGAGIWTTAHFVQVASSRSYAPHLTDPAIIGHKIKGSPGKASMVGVNRSLATGEHDEEGINDPDSLSSLVPKHPNPAHVYAQL